MLIPSRGSFVSIFLSLFRIIMTFFYLCVIVASVVFCFEGNNGVGFSSVKVFEKIRSTEGKEEDFYTKQGLTLTGCKKAVKTFARRTKMIVNASIEAKDNVEQFAGRKQ